LTCSTTTPPQAVVDRAAYQATCLRLGATIAAADGGGAAPSRDPHIFWAEDAWKKGECIITYYVTEIGQSLTYDVPLSSNGSFESGRYTYNRDTRCAGHPEDFHADTGVCVVVGFLS
jgi:hypothetical protein